MRWTECVTSPLGQGGACQASFLTRHTQRPRHKKVSDDIHTYIHACIHTYMHRWINTYIHTSRSRVTVQRKHQERTVPTHLWLQPRPQKTQVEVGWVSGTVCPRVLRPSLGHSLTTASRTTRSALLPHFPREGRPGVHPPHRPAQHEAFRPGTER